MYIFVGSDKLDEIKARHTVLELETFEVDGKKQTAYCVLAPEVIALGTLPDLERLCRLHQATVDALNREDFVNVIEGITHLKGKLGADMDSFYEIIQEKVQKNVEASPS